MPPIPSAFPPPPTSPHGPPSSIAADEVARFAAMAEGWWDPDGAFAPLHRYNPVRLGYVREHLVRHFGRDPASLQPFRGLRLLDVGCGGGLLTEPMARLGATMVGVDATQEGIQAARLHAEEADLAIDYRHGTAEALLAAGERFDAILAMEIVEHVADLPSFVATCAGLLVPGGALVIATLNRTARSFALAIVGAEYLLRWVPRGTHDWRKFVRPAELAGAARGAGLALDDATGAAYHPLSGSWTLGRDLAVNYLAFASTPPAV
jgi:2-polyprenyl-6-hydroxyphenyl methylase/3-demethylubiquinone-9 3-methyltransferase